MRRGWAIFRDTKNKYIKSIIEAQLYLFTVNAVTQKMQTWTSFELDLHADGVVPLSRNDPNKPCVKTGVLCLEKYRIPICFIGLEI